MSSHDLKKEAFLRGERLWLVLPGIANVGKADRRVIGVTCRRGDCLISHEGRRTKIQLECAPVSHRQACPAGRGNGPVVGLFESGNACCRQDKLEYGEVR